MTARLILLTGSQAGLEAPLQNGFYMIGRHADCQIRPKSRSVSRRHCLVHHHDEGMRILDLGSASGTRLNDEKLPVKTWHAVKEGDTVRFGKVKFGVSLAGDTVVVLSKPTGSTIEVAPIVTGSRLPSPQPSVGKAPAARPSMVTGAAWETFDVAEFLESEDDQDRQDRYDQIRATNVSAEEHDVDFDDESVVDSFDDDAATVVEELPEARQSSKRPSRTFPPPDKGDWNVLLARLRPTAEIDSLKLVAAFIAVVLVIGILSWKAYQFTHGPEIRVIKQID